MTTLVRPDLFKFDDLIHNRLFRIPSYQRAYSWRSRQRRELFQDIEHTWEADDGREHFMSTVVGLQRHTESIMTVEHRVIDVVDGQQRLTTLILLLKSISNALNRNDPVENRLHGQISEMLVKEDETSLLLLQTNHDSSNYFADYIRTGIAKDPTDARTLADRELLQAIKDCESFVARWQESTESPEQEERGSPLTQLVGLLRNRLTFIFHQITDEAVVYTVFEVLNSRGLVVSQFDRLKSLLMSIIFETESGNKEALIGEVHRLWSDIYRLVGLRPDIDSYALRYASTLWARNRPSKLLGEQAGVNQLLERAGKSSAGAINVTTWIRSVANAVVKITDDSRMSTVGRINQAKFLATAINLRDDFSESEKADLLRAWESVSYRIYGLLELDARWMVGDYVRLSWDVINRELKADEVADRILKIGSGFSAESVIEKIRGTDWYPYSRENLRYFLHRYEEHLSRQAGQKFDNEQWNRIWEASLADSIEHILPQSSDSPEMHRLGNLIILPPGLNSQLGDKEPWEKAEAYQKTGLLQAQEVVPYLSGWSEQSIENREQELLQWAAQEWADS